MQPLPPASAIDRIWKPRTGIAGAFRLALLALAGSLLLALSAKIQVPFYPVPMTLQTAAVLLLGAAYGPRMAAATVLLYLLEGALGLPVFAGTPERGVGLAYMLGPTGGYLAGFLPAAWIAGKAVGSGWRGLALALAFLAAMAAIYLPGLLWLAGFVGGAKAVAVGFVPFIWGDLLKLALAAALVEAVRMHGRGK